MAIKLNYFICQIIICEFKIGIFLNNKILNDFKLNHKYKDINIM